MTREDINNIIQTLCPNNDDFEKPIISPAYLKTELEALAIEQEPCGDVISRTGAIEALKAYFSDEDRTETEYGAYWHHVHVIDVLKALPPVTLKPCSNAIDRAEAIYIASGFCHPANVAKELAKLPPVTPEPKTDVLDKIKGYIDYIRNTGMGKKKSLEFIEKFIEGLKAESEE